MPDQSVSLEHTPSGGYQDDYSYDEIIAASGISLRLWRLYAFFWLIVCFALPGFYLATAKMPGTQLFVAWGALALFGIAYFAVMWAHPLGRKTFNSPKLSVSVGLSLVLVFLATLLSVIFDSSFTWLFIGVAAIVGVVLPSRMAFWSVTLLTLLSLGLSVFLAGGIYVADWLHILPLALLVRGLGLDMVGLGRLADALRELKSAREELAHQAVKVERNRLARDVHDLLGHSLLLITKKSELAGYLFDKEPGRARLEIQQIQQTARQALREVRSTVANTRLPTIENELAQAASLLRAAGVDFKIKSIELDIPAAIESALAWAVREGVTNVIRHSQAKNCMLKISEGQDGKIQLEIENDGCAIEPENLRPSGSGLAGLVQRVSSLGGQMEFGPVNTRASGAFRLWISLPVHVE